MCSPKAPDTSKADANAAQMVQLNKDQFDWVKQQYVAEAPDRAAASARANQVSDLDIQSMQKQIAMGDEAAQDYRTIYKPIEQRQAADAMNYDSEAHGEELAGRAQADVQHGFETARANADRSMAGYGVNPGDGVFTAGNNELQREEALSESGARTKARSDADTMGRALRADAIGVGRGVIGSQATTTGLALNAGSGSVNASGMPLNYAQNGVNMVSNAAGQATNGLNAAGNIYMRSADLQAQAQQGASAGLGSLAGSAMTAAALF